MNFSPSSTDEVTDGINAVRQIAKPYLDTIAEGRAEARLAADRIHQFSAADRLDSMDHRGRLKQLRESDRTHRFKLTSSIGANLVLTAARR